MGAGKSTVGRMLADRMDLPFYDLDKCIEQQEGQSIPEIFEAEGEKGFRRREQQALLDVIREKKGVVALGGGTLQNQHLLDHLKVNGLLVYVSVPLDTILDRIGGDTGRPLLVDEKGAPKPHSVLGHELQELYEQRKPYYEQAEVTIHADRYNSPPVLVAHLLKKIRYHVALH